MIDEHLNTNMNVYIQLKQSHTFPINRSICCDLNEVQENNAHNGIRNMNKIVHFVSKFHQFNQLKWNGMELEVCSTDPIHNNEHVQHFTGNEKWAKYGFCLTHISLYLIIFMATPHFTRSKQSKYNIENGPTIQCLLWRDYKYEEWTAI